MAGLSAASPSPHPDEITDRQHNSAADRMRAIEQAVWSEELGLDSVFLPEHHFTDGYPSAPAMQHPGGADLMPKVATHVALNPGQDAQVQYAMEGTTVNGTAAATVTFGQRAPGTVIGKTGTTASANSGFFLGATTQYALVVGMFTSSPGLSSSESLSVLGGGGFGSYWPAKIWNTFAAAEFAKTPMLFPTNPSTAGQAWNQVG